MHNEPYSYESYFPSDSYYKQRTSNAWNNVAKHPEGSLAWSSYYNRVNEESAAQQMKFQEYMSNTSHQREVSDLMAAGLNPMMSLNNGASSPSGAGFSADSSATAITTNKQQMKNQLKLQKLSNENAMKIAQAQIEAQKYMNKYSADLAYQSAIYGANASASAQRYSSSIGAYASMYNADQSLVNAREQRAWDSANPNNPYRLGASLFNGIKLKNSYSGNNSANKVGSSGNKKANKGRT